MLGYQRSRVRLKWSVSKLITDGFDGVIPLCN